MDHRNIKKKTDDALNSFDGAERAIPAPYLLTRINVKLKDAESQSFWIKAGAFISRPLVATSVIIVFVMMNFLAITFFQTTNNVAKAQSATTTNYDFAINVSSIYDIENPEP